MLALQEGEVIALPLAADSPLDVYAGGSSQADRPARVGQGRDVDAHRRAVRFRHVCALRRSREMKGTVTVDAVIRALAEELAAALGGKLGGAATQRAGENLRRMPGGWRRRSFAAASQGRASVWFGRESAAGAARGRRSRRTRPASEPSLVGCATSSSRAFAALAARPQFDGVDQGDGHGRGRHGARRRASVRAARRRQAGRRAAVLHALLAASAARCDRRRPPRGGARRRPAARRAVRPRRDAAAGAGGARLPARSSTWGGRRTSPSICWSANASSRAAKS